MLVRVAFEREMPCFSPISYLVLNLLLHIFNRVRRLDLKCDRFPSKSFDKDLHLEICEDVDGWMDMQKVQLSLLLILLCESLGIDKVRWMDHL